MNFNPFLTPKGQVVEVDGSEDVSGIELTYEGEAEDSAAVDVVAGRVVDDLGNPVEGAKIRADAFQMGVPIPASATSGPEGSFLLKVKSQGAVSLRVSKKGFSPAKVSDVQPGEKGLTLTLERTGTVAGHVFTVDGSPPATSFQVSFQRPEQSFAEKMETSVNRFSGGRNWQQGEEDGSFVVEDVPTGPIEVTVRAPGFAPAHSPVLTMAPGGEITGVRIVVREGASISGKVTLEGRDAVGGASIVVQPASDSPSEMLAQMMPNLFGSDEGTVTDEQGVYEVKHLAAGKYTVIATHPEYAPSEPITVTLREDEVQDVPNLVMSLGGTVEGRLTDAEGNAKGGLMVQLMGDGAYKMAQVDSNGHFLIEHLKPGDYMLNIIDTAAMQKGSMQFKTRAFSIMRDETVPLEIVYGLGFRIFGKVEGLAAGGMRMIQLRRPGGPAPEEIDPTDMKAGIEANKYLAGVAMISPENTYEIQDVEAGSYILEIPKMPADPTDIEAYSKMDRTPHYRTKITVEKDAEHDIEIQKKKE